jgi:dephospho-CoA kinase
MNNKKVIAIVGMAGSGKSEVVRKLQKDFGIPKVYFGEITFDEIKKRGLEVNYKNERIVREDLRSKYGMGAYAKFSIPKIKKFLEKNDIVLLESLYSWDEYKIIKKEFKQGFLVLAVYASPKTRFERLKNRTKERPIKDWQEFKTRDWTEVEGTQKGGPIAMADFTIINEGSKKEYLEKIEKFFKKII